MSKVFQFLKGIFLHPVVIGSLAVAGGIVVLGFAIALGFKDPACKLAEAHSPKAYLVMCVESVPAVDLGK